MKLSSLLITDTPAGNPPLKLSFGNKTSKVVDAVAEHGGLAGDRSQAHRHSETMPPTAASEALPVAACLSGCLQGRRLSHG
jgi:hypothetical protein